MVNFLSRAVSLSETNKISKKENFFYFKTLYPKIKKQILSRFLIKTNKKCKCSIMSIYSLIAKYSTS